MSSPPSLPHWFFLPYLFLKPRRSWVSIKWDICSICSVVGLQFVWTLKLTKRCHNGVPLSFLSSSPFPRFSSLPTKRLQKVPHVFPAFSIVQIRPYMTSIFPPSDTDAQRSILWKFVKIKSRKTGFMCFVRLVKINVRGDDAVEVEDRGGVGYSTDLLLRFLAFPFPQFLKFLDRVKINKRKNRWK